MALVSKEGRFLGVNPRLCDIVGYDQQALLQQTFQAITHPDDLDSDLEHVRKLLDREEPYYSMEKRYFHRRGHVVWVRLTVSSVRDQHNQFQYFVAQIEDVSERRATEASLLELNEQLTEKNREIYSFAHSASHDLKEPVRTIGGYAMFLGEQPAVAGDPESVGFVANIKEATGRMIELIESLLKMAEVGASSPSSDPVPLGDVIDRVEHDLHGRLKESGGAIHRADKLPILRGNPVQIRQVFQNLVANGLKFRKPGVAPVVSITTEYLPPPSPDGRWLLAVTLADNGIGFPSNRVPKLFEPFKRFHARSEYPGTGLGLAIVRRVVERHGGTISAAGAEGQGARFTFTLPVDPPAEEIPEAA
jgi:PAS domain S-box-containing protein